jgi:hypothetical protein
MPEEVSLKPFRWGGMLSIWGQGENAYQGVCYSGLAYNPADYIDIIAKDAPPVEKWLVRYVDLKLANDWLAYCINHILPDEILKHIVFSRVHSKANWPAKYQTIIDGEEIIDEYNFDETDDDGAEVERERLRKLQRTQYGGCLPWLRISFSQELPANVIFAVGVLLRYASEHGAVLKMVDLLPQLEPSIPPEQRLSIAMNIGGARGHALSSWGYGYLEEFRDAVEQFSWKKHFLKMMKLKPFYAQPHKQGSVDDYFAPKWSKDDERDRTEVYCHSYANNPLKRNDLVVWTTHNMPNKVMRLWDKKEK